MKTKTIFKMLAAAMLMPAMLLTTACSNSDDEIINTENPTNTKGYALPVTINVTRQGDTTTRATYTDNGNKTGSLSFSTGDKLFVQGSYNEGAYIFAGMLDYVSDGKFSGTIMTQTEWTGTTEELLSADGGASATLLPAGYGEYGYLSIADEGTYEARLSENPNKAFATSKATAVEQFSWEDDNDYSSGFELTPVNAILNFTINGLDASTEVNVSFSYPNYPEDIVVSGKVTTDGDGTATFAIGIIYGNNLKDCTLTVGGNAITLPADKEVEAGKIYNISRSVSPIISLSGRTYEDEELVIPDGYIVTGYAIGLSCKVAVADGATVTLRDVENNNSYLDGGSACPGIKCLGDATIILEGNNTVKGGGTYAGIYVPEGKTLTIRGTGSLTVTGGSGGGAGIGGNNEGNCGSIVISGGTITATGGSGGAGIGLGFSSGCEFGDITISGGTVTAKGGSGGAGIGLGASWGGCKDITISGGTVAAMGSDGAPGIGGVEGVYESITITDGVTKVTVNKGSYSTYSIGIEDDYSWEGCGPITIGGTVYFDEGSFTNNDLMTSPFVYQP